MKAAYPTFKWDHQQFIANKGAKGPPARQYLLQVSFGLGCLAMCVCWFGCLAMYVCYLVVQYVVVWFLRF